MDPHLPPNVPASQSANNAKHVWSKDEESKMALLPPKKRKKERESNAFDVPEVGTLPFELGTGQELLVRVKGSDKEMEEVKSILRQAYGVSAADNTNFKRKLSRYGFKLMNDDAALTAALQTRSPAAPHGADVRQWQAYTQEDIKRDTIASTGILQSIKGPQRKKAKQLPAAEAQELSMMDQPDTRTSGIGALAPDVVAERTEEHRVPTMAEIGAYMQI
ncbi:uncharacterized protein JCM10292_006438 [Rhodotorula paludigena]|uniref:uncharacterized protein n=1 Tax=Rhodotorula paludigena TaxID=86838 RepID=UPI0031704091